MLISTRRLKALLVVAGSGCLLGDGCCEDVSAPPPPRMYIAGPTIRGATFQVCDERISVVNCPPMVAHVTFTPADAAQYDSTTRLYTWIRVGQVTLTETDVTSPFTLTVTVVDAPTVFFDMEVDGNRDIYSATTYGLD